MRKMPNKRRGVITPLAAILLVFLLGMIAFSVDVGYMTLAQSELQSAADAAALAGAGQLMQGFVQYNLPNQTGTNKASIQSTAQASARTGARTYAGYNACGDVKSLTLNDSDIEFGFTDANNNYTPQPTYTGYPNTVKVTLRRDSSANGALGLFFAPVLGAKSQNLQATASATIFAGTINSFTAPPTTRVLPVTYDVNDWKNFVATGLDPDGNISLDINSNPELRIYPSVKSPGNFGQLSLDDGHVGTPVETGWVDNGMSASDLSALTSANVLPLSAHDPTKWDWLGDTGMKGSLVSDINSHVGEVFLLALFNPYSPAPSYSAGTGNGSHYNYQVVQFVAVKIMPSAHNTVTVEPAAAVEGNAAFLNLGPAGTGSTSNLTTFSTPKLTH
jgi:Flp pilus assembly protein TadG